MVGILGHKPEKKYQVSIPENTFIIKESNIHPFMNFDLMTWAHSLLVHYGSVELRPPELKGCPSANLASIKM